MSDRKIMKMSDEFIGEIAKLLSLSLMTGTDITYHFRQMRLEALDGENLTVTPEYSQYISDLVTKMTEEVQRKLAEMDVEESGQKPS